MARRRSASPDLAGGSGRLPFPASPAPGSPSRGQPNHRQPPPSPTRGGGKSNGNGNGNQRQAPAGGWWFEKQDIQTPDDAFPPDFRNPQPRLAERLAAARAAGRAPGSLDPPGRSTSPSRHPGGSPNAGPARRAWVGGLANRTRYSYQFDTVVEVSVGAYRWRGKDMDEQGLQALEERWDRDYGLVPGHLKEQEGMRETLTKAPQTRAMVFDDLLLDPDLQAMQQLVPPELAAFPLNLRVDRCGNVVSDECDQHSLCHFEVDHVWPHARRGRTEPGNLQALLWLSNRTKSDAIHNSFVRRADGGLYMRRRVTTRHRASRGRDARRQGPTQFTMQLIPLQCGVTPALLRDLWASRLNGPITTSAADRDARFIEVLHLLLRRNWLVFAGHPATNNVIAALLAGGAAGMLQQFYSKIEAFGDAVTTLQAVIPYTQPLPPLPAPLPNEDSDGSGSDEEDPVMVGGSLRGGSIPRSPAPRRASTELPAAGGGASLKALPPHTLAPLKSLPSTPPLKPMPLKSLTPLPPKTPSPVPRLVLPLSMGGAATPSPATKLPPRVPPLVLSLPLVLRTRMSEPVPAEGPPPVAWWRKLLCGWGQSGTGRVGVSG